MIILLQTFTLIAVALFMAWRYSKTEADPDIAMFTLQGMTGAKYGADFADCKTPFIHWYFYLIARVVGQDMAMIKFTHHSLVGLAGLVMFVLTGNFWPALAFTVLINAGWLFSFTGNVGQVPAAALFIALFAANPWAACSLAVLAVLFEPKLLPSFIALVIIQAWYIPALTWLGVGLLIGAVLYWRAESFLWWMIEAVVIIPRRMNATRRKHKLYQWQPWFTGQVTVYIFPWLIFAVWARPDPLYWLPPLAYILFIAMGYVIRPHHLIPLVPWIAGAGIDPVITLALLSTDFVSSGFYLGDIWMRHYMSFAVDIRNAAEAGKSLENTPGTVWVNGMHTQAYTYARKKPPYTLVEQIEINQHAHERRGVMLARWKRQPPEWVIVTPGPKPVGFDPTGYRLVSTFGNVQVFGKV